MEQFFYILAKTVEIYLGVASLAMILRMIMPFFASDDNRLLVFARIISEPVIIPFRVLFSKLGVGENSIMDIPFFVAYLALLGLRMLLPVI